MKKDPRSNNRETQIRHVKARREKPAEYPERFPVPDNLVSWEIDYPGYNPPYYVSPVVLKNDSTTNPDGWADPEELTKAGEIPAESFSGRLKIDESGRPLNPAGRTGIAGRGLLGKWGPNYAADPIITRINGRTRQFEMLAIERRDNGQWAIPGGMVDKGEEVAKTLARELMEETGVSLDMSEGNLIYRGYVDDPRNTDNSWMETTAKHLHLPPETADSMELKAGSDARAVRWLPLTTETVGNLYASHASFVIKTLTAMIDARNKNLSEDDLQGIEKLLHSLVN
jgi:ADP-ribose pyrophosphatase